MARNYLVPSISVAAAGLVAACAVCGRTPPPNDAAPLTAGTAAVAAEDWGHGLPLEKIKLPPGFRIDVYAYDVPGARSLAVGERGTLFVGTRKKGNVYAISDRDGDGRAEDAATIAEGLNNPNGVAFRDGALYVAEIHRVIRFDDVENRLQNPPAPVVVNDAFPRDKHHGWKFIRFGPDGKLYVPVGAPCNVCERDDERYASIMRMDADGSELEVFARGVRNTAGFDWHPRTGEL